MNILTTPHYSETVDNIVALAFVMLQRRSRATADEKVKFVQTVVSRQQLQWYVWPAPRLIMYRVAKPQFVGGKSC